MSATYMIVAILIASAITFGLRAFPFLIQTRLANSAFMANFAKWMPIGAMVILFIYALGSIPWHRGTNEWVPYLLGLAVTISLHLWRKNFLLSIISGTIVCVCASRMLN